MLHLKATRQDWAVVARREKRLGYCPEAFYDHRTDRIIIIKSGKDIIGTLNHEFMHRVLVKSRLYMANYCWDSDFIYDKVERWLGWDDNFLDVLMRKLRQKLRIGPSAPGNRAG